MRSPYRLAAAVVLGLSSLLLVAAPALAEPPFRLADAITDQVGALDGDEGAVQQAIDALREDDGTQLFVVYVASFDGADPVEWAREAADLSQLGASDVLFAVAVEDRAYAVSVDDGFRLSDAEVDELAVADVEPRLGDDDWSGAAVALAEGLRGGGIGGGTIAAIAGVLVVGGGGGYVYSRRRSARKAEERVAAEFAARDPHHGTPTEQLNGRASEELLTLDEAVATSELDLAYAQAQYGDAPIAGFRDALDASKAELAQAFTIRQQLDDEVPEDDRGTRTLLAQLLALTAAADARLDGQAESFARLRAIEQHAGQELEQTLAPRSAELATRVPAAAQALRALEAGYAPAAWSPVAENVAGAEARLADADRAIAAGRAEVQAGRATAAVAPVRAAEDALAQAATLLDAVDRTAADIAAAGGRVEAVRAETTRDLAEADALLTDGIDTPGLREQVQRARTALADADQLLHPAAGALPDPLGALRRLDEADRALEEALAPARDARAARDRAAEALPGTLASARSAVDAAGDFVATRRGDVGGTARTRLAEAQRHLGLALGATDPVVGVAEGRRAGELARQALDTAEQDVRNARSARSSSSGWSSGGGGSFGGGRRTSSSSSGGGRRASSSGGGGRRGSGGRF